MIPGLGLASESEGRAQEAVISLVSDLPGVKPARQQRSLERQRALLNAGRELLRRENFEQVTIEKIASRAGCSVGTFYSRFEDKEAFLRALQEDVFSEQIAAAKEALARGKWQDRSAEDVIRAATGFVIDTFRDDGEGLTRASLASSATNPEIWAPVRRSGIELADIIVVLLADRVDPSKHDDPERAVRIAVQLLYGTLINAILHDPGPLSLDDPDIEEQVAKIVIGYLA